MPFPLQALDYGSRRRLRQLATPGEAYDLQIAAPHFDGLQPIQKIHDQLSPYASVLIDDNNKVFIRDYKNKELKTDDLYIVKKNFRIEKFTSNHGAHLITTRFILAPLRVIFVSCNLTTKFLQDFSTKTKTDLKHLKFENCTFHDDVSLDFVCLHFKKLQNLSVFDSYFLKRTWIDTLILHSYTNMKNIDIYDASIDLLKVEEKQLIKFVEAQSKGFKIDIKLKDDCNDTEVRQALNHLFRNQIWRRSELNVPMVHRNVIYKPNFSNSIEKKIAIIWHSTKHCHLRSFELREG